MSRFRSQRPRGFTFLELLIAVLILSVAASAAVATWGMLSKIPGNKRVTEMGVYVGSQEMERLKVQTYNILASGTSGYDWYDKYGAYINSLPGAPTNATYKASWSVSTVVNRDATVNSEDMIELVVTVTNSGATKTYETARTLLTFGGE